MSHSQQVFWLLEQQNPGNLQHSANFPHSRQSGRPGAGAQPERTAPPSRNICRCDLSSERTVRFRSWNPASRYRLRSRDLSALDPGALGRAALKLALETVREPFDLESGPVLRARLVRLTAENFLLCIAIHHAVSDGLTGSILLDELVAIYDALTDGQANPLPELDLQFTDYAAWEREWMDGSRLERELEYWRTVLQGAPAAVDLPLDIAGFSAADRRGRLLSTTISGESLSQLQAFAQRNRTTLFTVLAAALRVLLYRWSGQADFLLGTIASNRSRSGTERMIGCFVNPLPLRNPIAEGQSALQLFNNEKDAVMGALAHQDCPLARIVEDVNPERTISDNPLFNVALLLQSFPAIERTGRCFHAEHFNFDAELALLDLRFIATETAGGLQIDCEYRTGLFQSRTIENLLASFAGVLQQLAAAPETEVGKIEISKELLQRGTEHRRARHKQTIAIAANFTVEPVEEPLAFWMEQLQIPSRIQFAPFDQVFQQLLDSAQPAGG